MANEFNHGRLPGPQYTRVIILQPAATPKAPIKCRLEPLSLSDCPEFDGTYTALSYSWDAEKPTCEIDCHDKILFITPNCDAAIRQLRHVSLSTTLWVDSICIDQGQDAPAIEERNNQVSLMGKIYKAARRVVAWVGKSDSQTEKALDLISNLARFLEETAPARALVETEHYMRLIIEDITKGVTKSSEDPFEPLFSRSWFSRVWTVQEVTLPILERVFLRCSNIELPWTAILLIVAALKSAKYPWGSWDAAVSLQRQLTRFITCRRDENLRQQIDLYVGEAHLDNQLRSLLVSVREKKTSDPKDRIFGFYGICSELGIALPLPNYSQRVEDIYREATIACISQNNSLKVLYHTCSEERRDGLPSWVPDWNAQGFSGWHRRDIDLVTNQFPRPGNVLSVSSGVSDPSDMSNALDEIWHLSHDRLALLLKGKIVDTIRLRTSSIVRPKNLWDSDHQDQIFDVEALSTVRDILKTCVVELDKSSYPTGESGRDALWATFCDLHVQDINIQSEDIDMQREPFEDWYTELSAENSEVPEIPIMPTGVGNGTHTETSDQLRISLKLIFLVIFRELVQMKCLFFTKGGYFGLAPDPLPASIQAGDKIVVVQGLAMPLVLRPIESRCSDDGCRENECNGGTYKLITHAFMRGITSVEHSVKAKAEMDDIALR